MSAQAALDLEQEVSGKWPFEPDSAPVDIRHQFQLMQKQQCLARSNLNPAQAQPMAASGGSLLQPNQFIHLYHHCRNNLLASWLVYADWTISVIHSYNLVIDTKTCAAPNELEFKRIYADWCREMERYRTAPKSWHVNRNECRASSQQQQRLGMMTSAGQQVGLAASAAAPPSASLMH